MELVEPSEAYKESFREGLEEFKNAGIHGFWDAREPLDDIDRYIVRTKANSQGIDLPENWVPTSTYWLVDNGSFIGHVNIRHLLNDRLRLIGGHIGYFIRPSMQRKGYGTELLRLALEKARTLGIEQALITCDADNIGSRKVIERNGGTLQREIIVDGKSVLSFHLDL